MIVDARCFNRIFLFEQLILQGAASASEAIVNFATLYVAATYLHMNMQRNALLPLPVLIINTTAYMLHTFYNY